jgi:hypothetical protein
MNYSKIYYSIVENRKKHPYNGYTETHHIVPKSLGGTNDKNNLVNLSAREHFICHLLLTKMYSDDTPNYYKMVKAFMMMLNARSYNQERFLSSRKYEVLREAFSRAQSISQSGQNNSQYGKIKSVDIKNKIRKSLILTLSKKQKKVKNSKEEIKNQRLINRHKTVDLYRNYYIIYKDNGFDKLVELTGYDKSKVNLVQRFKALLPEFVPQNGKKRGKSNIPL